METGFIWKGIHSSEKGLKIISLPNISTPEKREDKIIVPGRSGYLTIDDDSYEGEVKPVEFDIKHNNFDDIKSWLSGSGEVIFSNEPDRYYKARIINKLDLVRVLEKFHSGIVQFDCQPFGYSLDKKPITWNKELLEGLSGNDYDLSKLHPFFKAHINGVIKIDNKQWIKYVYDSSANIASCLATNTLTLKSNTQYTFKVNGLMESGTKEIRMYVKDQNGDYGVEKYTISSRMRNYTYTFSTKKDSTFTVIHITGLDEKVFSLFSDFSLMEGNGEGINLIENSGAVLDATKWIKHSGGGATSTEVFLYDRKNYPRRGIGFQCIDISKGWCILVNTSLADRKFRFDTEKEYTLSCVIYSDKKARVQLQICDGGQTTIVTLKNLDLEVGFNKINYTFKPLVEGNITYVRFALFTNEHGINVFDLKLEEGDKATPWQLSSLDKRLYVENKGTRKSNPIINVYGTGDITLYVNKETIKFTNVEDKITINTEMMECYKDTLPCNNKMVGEFPIFTIGQNNITWAGNVNRIEVEPNTVFL